jgi:hypothetical protein
MGFDDHRNRKPVYGAARAYTRGSRRPLPPADELLECLVSPQLAHTPLSKSQPEQHHEYLNRLLAIRGDVA